jgi:large conductance mechanosensitive channel
MKKPRLSEMITEFKTFAFKGNMIDLAVAVVLGAAFKTVIDAVVSDVIMPIVSIVTPGQGHTYETWHLWRFPIGHLIAVILNFLLVAAAVFLVVVKIFGAVMKATHRKPEPDEPTTKECPFCLSVIPIKATKCAHCTADLPAPPAAAAIASESTPALPA